MTAAGGTDVSAIAAAVSEDATTPRSLTRLRPRGWLVRRALLAADVFGLLLAYTISRIALPLGGSEGTDETWKALVFVATLPIWILLAKLLGLYDRDEERTDHNTPDDAAGVFHLVTTGAWVIVIARSLTPFNDVELDRILVFWAAAFSLILASRAAVRFACRRNAAYIQNTVIVGAGEVGSWIAEKLSRHPEYGLELIGFVDGVSQPTARDEPSLLGTVSDLPDLVQQHGIERVIIGFPQEPASVTSEVIRQLGLMHVQIDIVPRFFNAVGRDIDPHDLEGLTLLGLRPFSLARSSKMIKRAFDTAAAIAALVLVAPLFALIALLIKLDSPGPIFFRQVRIGLRGRPFKIWKFRTMVVDAEKRKAELAHLNHHHASGDARMFKVADDPRVTRVGRFLRRAAVDELPQLFNVVAGQMSLVGPRPLIPAEDQHVQDWGRRRLDLRPGITGPWQVRGSSNVPFEEMMRLDYMYVTSWSLLLDIALMFRTIPAVFRRRHAY